MRKKIIPGLIIAIVIGIIVMLYTFQSLSIYGNRKFIIAEAIPHHYHEASQNEPFENILRGDQHDPQLISFLRDKVVKPWSGLEYNLSYPEKEDILQSQKRSYLLEYFKEKEYGTFVEARALDGEQFSNTLILERKLGWSGLLIEQNPLHYKNLLKKHRKAYHAECGLSFTTRRLQFNISFSGSSNYVLSKRTKKGLKRKKDKKFSTVNFYPLYSLMVSANLTTLDLLSLNLESLEVKVLKTIPWEDVNIKSIIVRVNHIPEGKEFIKQFMEHLNYRLEFIFPIDFFFVKNNAGQQ